MFYQLVRILPPSDSLRQCIGSIPNWNDEGNFWLLSKKRRKKGREGAREGEQGERGREREEGRETHRQGSQYVNE